MWSKLDDGFPDHPKVVEAGPLASWLYVCGLCYCNRYLTDGFIPVGQVRRLADVADALMLADRLVEVGLWEEVEGGFAIHDFHDLNMTAEEAKERREEISRLRSEAGRRGANARWQNGKRDSNLPSKPHGKSDGKNMAPNPIQNQNLKPVPKPKPKPTKTTIPPDFCLTLDLRQWAVDEKYDILLDIEKETAEFVEYWTEGEGQGERRKNWGLVWKNRIKDRAERVSKLGKHGGSNGTNSREPINFRSAITERAVGSRLDAAARNYKGPDHPLGLGPGADPV